MKDQEVPLLKAVDIIRKEEKWDNFHEHSLREAIDQGFVTPHRYSLRPKARIYVKMSEVRKYVRKVKSR